MKELRDRIHNMIQSMARPGPLFLIFHDNHQDLKYLRSPKIEAPLEGLSFFLPESCAEAESTDTLKIFVIDTAELFAALEGDSGGQKRSLERVCRLLQIKSTLAQHLHNAGNDARVIIFTFPLPRAWRAKGRDSARIWLSRRWPAGTRWTCNEFHAGHSTQAITAVCGSNSPKKTRTAMPYRQMTTTTN